MTPGRPSSDIKNQAKTAPRIIKGLGTRIIKVMDFQESVNLRLLKSKINLFILGFLAPLLLTSCGGGDSSSSSGVPATPTPKKDISATAGNYGEKIFVGEDPTPSPLTGVYPPDTNTRYASADKNICKVDNVTGAVTGVNEGDCRITLTLSRTDYNDKIIEYVIPIVPLGNISVTAGSYGEKIVAGSPSTPSPLTGLDPSDADAVYVSSDENVCTVDRDTGEVTGVYKGDCRITLTLSKAGYNDKVVEYVTPVFLSLHDFKGEHIFKGLYLGTYTKPISADVDGDGDNDLVVGLQDGTLKYYRKNPVGSPTLFSGLTGADNPFDGFDVGDNSSPTFADIDGDGDQDLLVGESNGTLKYFLNESASGIITFTEQTSTDNPFNGFDVGDNASPTFTDIDGDGDLDLVVGKDTGILKFYLNESTGGSITFTPKVGVGNNPLNGIDAGGQSVPVFIDISGDGKLDLIVGVSDGALKYYLNESTTETITFTEKTSTDNPFNGFDVGNNSAPVFVDVNSDGDKDLVIGEFNGILNYFLNESTADTITFTEKTTTENPFNSFDVGTESKPTFADIDGDDDLDLVVGASNGILNYFFNESTGGSITFTPKTGAGNNPFNGFDVGDYSAPTFADIDGDGDQDLAVGEIFGTSKYFLNESTTDTITFTEKTTTENPFNSFDVGIYSAPKFVDIDEDGDPDLVVGAHDGTLKYFLNESTGGTIIFTPQTNTNNPFNDFDVGDNATPTFADIDGDGDPDLVVGESGGTFKYFLNESAGSTITFTPKTSASDNPFNGFDVGTASSPTFTDIDGDGDLDLIVGGGNGRIFTSFNYFGTWVPFF